MFSVFTNINGRPEHCNLVVLIEHSYFSMRYRDKIVISIIDDLIHSVYRPHHTTRENQDPQIQSENINPITLDGETREQVETHISDQHNRLTRRI